MRRARDYRGRDDGLPHCYNQLAMEEINSMTAGFQWKKAMFVFRAIYDYKGKLDINTDYCNVNDMINCELYGLNNDK